MQNCNISALTGTTQQLQTLQELHATNPLKKVCNRSEPARVFHDPFAPSLCAPLNRTHTPTYLQDEARQVRMYFCYSRPNN